MDLFGFPNINAHGQKYQVFTGDEATTTAPMQIFNVPRNATLLHIYAMSAGGGGGSGLNDVTAASRGGGGGGASGSFNKLIVPTLMLPEQQIGFRIGQGGAGGTGANPGNPGSAGTTTLIYIPSNQSILLTVQAGGGGAAGTAAGAAAGGVAGGTPNASNLLTYGITAGANGSTGSTGGTIAGAVGGVGNSPSGNWYNCPGAGGGSVGTDNNGKAGGTINQATTPFPANQVQGLGTLSFPFYFGGGGGGASLDGAATDGRRGSYGSGGGGGGGGQSGGNGGNGGPGFVIVAWS